MEKVLIVLAAMAGCGPAWAQWAASNWGTTGVAAGSTASAAATGLGSASSQAFNQGHASVHMGLTPAGGLQQPGISGGVADTSTCSGNCAGLPGAGPRTIVDTTSGHVGIGAVTETANMSGVVTTQTGGGLASAAAGGLAAATSVGTGAFQAGQGVGAPQGQVQGQAAALTGTGAVSFQNGAQLQNAGMVGYYTAGAAASTVSTTVQEGFHAPGGYVVTGQPFFNTVTDAATHANAGALGNAGFSGAPAISNAGNAAGFLVNQGSAQAGAGASAGSGQ